MAWRHPADTDLIVERFPERRSDNSNWAHASGWALLSGELRHISCAVPVHNQPRELMALMPLLSDELTEVGYPWEMMILDCGSTDETPGVARRWCELPGFTMLRLPKGARRVDALVTALSEFSGDAVLWVTPEHLGWLRRIGDLISRWDAGDPVVSMTADLRAPMPRQEAAPAFGSMATRHGELGPLVLLDRQVARQALR